MVHYLKQYYADGKANNVGDHIVLGFICVVEVSVLVATCDEGILRKNDNKVSRVLYIGLLKSKAYKMQIPEEPSEIRLPRKDPNK